MKTREDGALAGMRPRARICREAPKGARGSVAVRGAGVVARYHGVIPTGGEVRPQVGRRLPDDQVVGVGVTEIASDGQRIGDLEGDFLSVPSGRVLVATGAAGPREQAALGNECNEPSSPQFVLQGAMVGGDLDRAPSLRARAL